ncbi:MAG: tetratricopeptide (TPR) repeat protein, partial [Gammaproteobacteria bacterium]
MRITLALTALALTVPAIPAITGAAPSAQPWIQTDDSLEALVAAERREADLLRRRGDARGAGRLLDELIEEEPGDAASRTLRALCRLDRGRNDHALQDAEQAVTDARAGDDTALAARCVRNLVHILLILGRSAEALELLDQATDLLEPERNVRDAWILGRALDASGARAEARLIFQHAISADDVGDWRGLLAKGRCERALGRIERASHTFVAADRAAQQSGGPEPDVLVALADLYFESEREVEAEGKRSAGDLYRKALELHPKHEDGLLGQFRLHRYNRRRSSRSPQAILAHLLEANPRSVDGLLASASSALDDGQLRGARETLTQLDELAPLRREKRTMEATLAWVEHRRDDCETILEELTRSTALDSRPEREVGRHLIELYRFAEAAPFLQRAVERDPTDHEAWTYLGRALANVGREDDAREALDKAEIAAAGRQDAWRNNMMLVLQHMRDRMVEEDFGELSFAWQPDAAEVLRTYLVPFYEDARVELAERYGYTPEPTHIEVFRKHEDFSVRSVGFQGFPALGVCFGPVVTSLSPLSHMRGSFSWART